ncbi:uncharacterized protein PG986_007734 [Apiospora aurea]|uniref:NAD(P)-binding domain-containing protein n=1 Tax=Apiospora aurea TaxID=335848 RepID=A0ABR1QE71_9PEZI
MLVAVAPVGYRTGCIGQLLATALLESSAELQLTLTDVIEPPIPSASSQHASRITTAKSDLTDTQAISSLLSTKSTAVYLLHGLMPGAAEAQMELGWKVNWDSHRHLRPLEGVQPRSRHYLHKLPRSVRAGVTQRSDYRDDLSHTDVELWIPEVDGRNLLEQPLSEAAA